VTKKREKISKDAPKNLMGKLVFLPLIVIKREIIKHSTEANNKR
jgi:hypothetical protein